MDIKEDEIVEKDGESTETVQEISLSVENEEENATAEEERDEYAGMSAKDLREKVSFLSWKSPSLFVAANIIPTLHPNLFECC